MAKKCNELDNPEKITFLETSLSEFRKEELLKTSSKIKTQKSFTLQIEIISAEEIQKEKTMRDVEAISKGLNTHFIFANLPISSKVQMISEMKLYRVETGKYIFKQNDIGKNFFIIAKGSVEVIIDDKPVAVLNPVESFGELALLQDFPRSASVKTLSRVYLWILDRKTFTATVKEASSHSRAENKKFIETLPLFSTMSHEQIESLVEKLIEFQYLPNKKIITEGEHGDFCYFVKEGNVVCLRNKQIINRISQGGYFGEQALLSNSVRTATVIAETNVKCIALRRNDLEEMLGSELKKIILENSTRITIARSDVLSKLDKNQQNSLMDCLETVKYNKNTLLIEAGTLKKSNIWLILHGKLKNSSGIVAESFSCIGDLEISSNSEALFEENIFTAEDTDVGVTTRESFLACIGYDKCNLSIEEIKALKRVSILRILPSGKFAALCSCLTSEKFADNEIIVKQNSPGNQLFFIQYGTVEIFQDGVIIRSITKNDYFGERSLLFDELRTASVIAKGEVCCWTLSKQDFTSILPETSRKLIMRRIEMQDSSVKLSDLAFIKVIGKGAYGKVFLVCEKTKDMFYALKVTSKKLIKRFELQDYIILERNILKALDHPFILKLVKNYEDTNNIYLLTEYVRGLDLFDLMRILNSITENDSKFYVACIILILEYLHERKIIYRDLKPENVRIDEDGYPKLIDFGTSKAISGRTYTIIGTPHYMAPEIILGQGYSYNADYWSLGIILYEIIFRSVPFGLNEENPFRIYESILTSTLTFPSGLHTSILLKDFIEILLSRNPAPRKYRNIEKIKAHHWLGNINWDMLIGKEMTAPHISTIKDSSSDTESLLSNKSNLDSIIAAEMIEEENEIIGISN